MSQKAAAPELALTVSGRSIELPRSEGGRPAAAMTGGYASREAADNIRAGNLREAAIWIERAHPDFDGIVRLVEQLDARLARATHIAI